LREYNVTAVLANDILGKPADMVISDPNPKGHVGGSPNDTGTLVYNSRTGVLDMGPIHDPTAILYVRTEDMVDENDPTQGLKPGVPVEPLILRANAGDCIDVTLSNRLLTQAVLAVGDTPVIDANGTAVFLDNGDPLFVADTAGLLSCGSSLCTAVDAALVSFDQMPELATFGTLIGANKRHRSDPLAPANGSTTFQTNLIQASPYVGLHAQLVEFDGSTTFQTNLIQASPYVGLHAQLVEFDGSRDNGVLAGKNTNVNNKTIVPPGQETSYRWYAGHLGVSKTVPDKKGRQNFVLTPTAVELGGSNLQPADVIKQGMKSLGGQLVIEPEGSVWPDAVADLEPRAGTDPNGPGHKTRAMVTVTPAVGAPFRDLSQIWAKGLTQYYANSQPVEHINGEGDGIPEDPQEGTGMAINYGIEPVWFRLGILPNAPFGNDEPPNSFGAQRQYNVFSNEHASTGGADPQTPVFTALPGMETRMRVTMPHGTNRGSTFTLHGHLWQRDPYITENNTEGFPASYYLNGDPTMGAGPGPGVGSKSIGFNPLGFYQGAQESIWPATSWNIVLPSAGGKGKVSGDYMFRDFASMGSASGLWGILRVEDAAPAP